jgi:hypothetical protein
MSDDSCLSFTTEETRVSVMKAEPWALVAQPDGNPRIPSFYPDSIIELCNEVDRLRALLIIAQGAA